MFEITYQLSGFGKALRMAEGTVSPQLLAVFGELLLSPGKRQEAQIIAIDLLLRTPYTTEQQDLVVEALCRVFSRCPAEKVHHHLLESLSGPGWLHAHAVALVDTAATSPYHKIRTKAVTIAAACEDVEYLRHMTGDAHSEVRAEAACALIDADRQLMGELLDCLLQPGASMEAVERTDRTFLKHPHPAFGALGKALLDGKYRDFMLVSKLRRLGVEPPMRLLRQQLSEQAPQAGSGAVLPAMAAGVGPG
ncbi:MAG: hypothetical protein AB1445_10005 [Bacillota bacterium]